MNFDLFSSHSPSSSLDVNMSFYCESPATIINNQVHLIPENHHNRNQVNNLTYRDPMYSIPPIPTVLNRPVVNQSTNCLPYNHQLHHHHHLNVSTSPLVYNQQQRFQHHLNHPNQHYSLNYQSYQQQQQQRPQQYPHHRPHQYPNQIDSDNFQLYHTLNQQQFNYNESPMDVNNLEINCVEVEINDSSNEAPIYSVETDDGQKVDPSPSSSTSNQNVLSDEWQAGYSLCSAHNQQLKQQQRQPNLHQYSKENFLYPDFNFRHQIQQSALANSDGNHTNDSYNISMINNNQREYNNGTYNDNDQAAATSTCTPNDDESDGVPEEILEIIESLEAERAAINANCLRSVSPSVF